MSQIAEFDYGLAFSWPFFIFGIFSQTDQAHWVGFFLCLFGPICLVLVICWEGNAEGCSSAQTKRQESPTSFGAG